MDKEQIKNLIVEVLREQGGVIPAHHHNNTDSPKLVLQKSTNMKIGSTTYDPGSLADGAGVTTTLAVVGVNLGDFVLPSFSLDLQGIILTGYVSAQDVVSFRFQNETTGTIDLASGTLSAIIINKK